MSASAERPPERVVLVVDDNEEVCRITARIISKAGHRVLEAHDGDKALALLTELGPAVIGLVVSDIVMPGMTGEELAGSIAQRWPTMPVLLISGNTGPSSRYHGPFLGKPFPAETLQAVVSQLGASLS